MRKKEQVEKLYRAYSDQLIRQAESILHDHDEACDVVSDVFAQLLNGDTTLQPETVGSFLFVAVRNRCMNILKRRKAMRRAYSQIPTDDTTEEYEEKPVGEIMHYIDTELTPQTQNVMQMRYNEAMSYNEIAEELGISRIAVYKHLSQGLGKLRSRFSPVAVVIALLLLVGIAFAAVHIVQTRHKSQTEKPAKETLSTPVNVSSPTPQPATIQFEDAELQDILSQMATHYQVDIVYRNDRTRHFHLHFTWETTQPLPEVVSLFNHFDSIHLSLEAQTLIVE